MSGLRLKSAALAAAFAVGPLGALAQTAPITAQPLAPPPGAAAPLTQPLGVRTLAAPDVASVGLVDVADPRRFWAGVDRARARSLLRDMGAPGNSAVMQSLARKLLLASALAPQGAQAGEGEGDFMSARLMGLVAMGEPALAQSLKAQMDPARHTPAMAEVMVPAYWLLNNREAACNAAFDLLDADPTPARQRQTIVCMILEGRGPQAELALALLAEQTPNDADFFALAQYGLGRANNPPVIKILDPMTWALLRARDATPARDWFAVVTNPAIDLGLMRTDKAPLDLRFAAAFRADAAGLVAPSDITRLLLPGASLEGDPPRADNPAPLNGARLLRAAYQDATDEGRAQKIQALFQWARRHHHFLTVAGLAAQPWSGFSSLLAVVPGQPAFDAVAPDIVAALMATGNYDAVMAWNRALTRRATAGDAQAARLRDRIWPAVFFAQRLTNLSPLNDQPPPRELTRILPKGDLRVYRPDQELFAESMAFSRGDYLTWADAARAADPVQAERRNLLVTGLLRGFGYDVPGIGAGFAVIPDPQLQQAVEALGQAARNQHQALTLILAHNLLRAANLTRADAPLVVAVAEALRAAGLAVEAQAFAAEAVAAFGL